MLFPGTHLAENLNFYFDTEQLTTSDLGQVISSEFFPGGVQSEVAKLKTALKILLQMKRANAGFMITGGKLGDYLDYLLTRSSDKLYSIEEKLCANSRPEGRPVNIKDYSETSMNVYPFGESDEMTSNSKIRLE